MVAADLGGLGRADAGAQEQSDAAGDGDGRLDRRSCGTIRFDQLHGYSPWFDEARRSRAASSAAPLFG
jgi:hypothetical protein